MRGDIERQAADDALMHSMDLAHNKLMRSHSAWLDMIIERYGSERAFWESEEEEEGNGNDL